VTSNTGFKLILREGPTPGQAYELDRPEVVIGRDASADLVIPSPAVSRRHARVTRQGDQHLLEDLGSSNGTFLNGQRLAQPAALAPGDQIGLGQTLTLVFEAPPDGGPAPPPAQVAPPELARTIMGEAISLPQEAAPPQFVVTVAGASPDMYFLTRERATIGRADDNDIVIRSQIVSRHHARLERTADGGYQLVGLPEAGNPVLLDGRPLEGSHRLRHEDKLRVGSLDPGTMVTMTYHSPSEAAALVGAVSIAFGERSQIHIGRDPGSDIVLDAPQVSRFHAQVERVGQRYRVRDLRSSNGTFVNGERIEGEVWLKPEAQIRVGPYRFVVGKDSLERYDETGGLRVDTLGLNKWVRKDLNILQNISLAFQPREFIVVVGQSGGGKSTLVDAIAGYRPATHGRVLVNEIDAYRNFDAIRSDIGYVPQRDIIHMELTVFQALDYAAQLRMPPDTAPAERHKRVMEVLDDLDLAHRKDVQISGLSGGQQKRVSIGVELLTKPGLFFLDEPTSGLDPGTETALMQLMRRLADQGRTIVLVTHATKNVMLADKVIFLARGGYLAWFGPPDEALRYFDQYRSERERRAGEMEFDQIYAILDDPGKGSPMDWAKRYQSQPACQRYIVQPLESKGQIVPVAARPARTGGRRVLRRVSSPRQFFILSARNLKILTRDRFSLFLMLAVAPLASLTLDLILRVLQGPNPFDFVTGNAANVLFILFLPTIYGVMGGGLAQMREIVKEQDIYKRERLVNLKVFPYVLSKVWVAALLSLYQAAANILILYLVFDMPGGAVEFVLMYITLALVTMAGMMLGLFVSALAPNANAAPLFVFFLLVPQIVLGGALVALPPFASAITSTRWGFEAFMSITAVGSDIAADICWALPEEQRKALSLEDKATLNCRCLGTGIFAEGSCSVPGVGKFYNPAIDQPPPEEPSPLRPQPPEPVLPVRPVEPADQSDSVAMAEYFDQLRQWEAEVTQIQDDYKAQLDAYQAEARIFQAEQIAYQESLANWQIARAQAVQPAEALIGQVHKDYGWTFVDKEDSEAFWFKIASTWVAQSTIITILLVGILVLQKRKDVV